MSKLFIQIYQTGTCTHFSNPSLFPLGLIHKAHLEVIMTFILMKAKGNMEEKTKKGKIEDEEGKENV